MPCRGSFHHEQMHLLGAIPNSEGAGGRRPTGSGGLGGGAPQWRGSSIYYLYIRTPELLSRTYAYGAGDKVLLIQN